MSTLIELAGFALLAYAGWLVLPALGFALGGGSLLLIGYAKDEALAATVTRVRVGVARLFRSKG